MTGIKFCGIRTLEEVEHVNRIKPDAIGFVFAPGYKRTISLEKARTLKEALDPDIKIFGVFKNNEPDEIIETAGGGIIDVIQLHGARQDDILELKNRTDLPLVQALSIKSEDDVLNAENSKADLVLLDAAAPGSGKSFNWKWIEDLKRPFILAGGLNPQNVKEAIERTHPVCVDVSSGIENEQGKDSAKMMAFKKAVEEADLLKRMNQERG